MDNAGIERLILGYSEHFEDMQYLAELVSSVERAALDNSIVELLRSGNAAAIGEACLLVRDLVLLGSRNEKCRQFRESYFDSSVVRALEELVTAPNLHIRRQAVYTLGKTGSVSSLPVLHHAFHDLLESDPLLVPGLVGEIFWLEGREIPDLIDEAVSSAQYLTRWAVLYIFACRANPEDMSSPEWQLRIRLYTRLVRDPSAWVRAEAEYQKAFFDYEAEYRQALLDGTMASPSMSKKARRDARREIERRRPSMCFVDLEIAFNNHLYENAMESYTVSELDEFVRRRTT